jgi:uncharacterized protein (UPF0212 family)
LSFTKQIGARRHGSNSSNLFVEHVDKPTDNKPLAVVGTTADAHPCSAGNGDGDQSRLASTHFELASRLAATAHSNLIEFDMGIMNCPICGANAEQIETTIDGVGINCPKCGEYDIASTVIAREQLHRLDPEERGFALGMARRSAQPGARPFITTYLLASVVL